MKHKKISIKWKVFLYMLSFSAILICLLWLFQTVYLDRFYKTIKKNDVNHALDNMESLIDDDDIQSAVDTIADRYEIGVVIADSQGNKIYSSETSFRGSINRFDAMRLQEIFQQAEQNNGKTEISIENHQKFEHYDIDFIENSEMETPKYDKLPNMPKNRQDEGIIKAKIVTTDTGEKYAVIVESIITPVSATVHTLRIQLIYISIIMVLLSLLIAFIISKRISKPIIQMNNSAKQLAKGNFDVEFSGNGYKEIAELSKTLNHTTKELSKSDVLQKELLANVSHDLRTPLTMITGYAEVMRDLPGENTPENVQVIIDEAKRLTGLVNDLLDISKIQAGVTELSTQEFDITESIKAVIERHSKLLEPYGYHIYFKYHENIIVDADEFKIYQVIYNLIANAVNYSKEDKNITVRQIRQGKHVRIEVTDHGLGIPKEKLENVWDRYYKIDKNHRRAIVGSGLGLSIVKNILDLHDAEYGVDSEEGKGSTFWFELPV